MTDKEIDLSHFQRPCLDGATLFKLAMLSCSFCQRHGGKMLRASQCSLLVCTNCAKVALEKAEKVDFSLISEDDPLIADGVSWELDDDPYCFWHSGESIDWQISVAWPHLEDEILPSCCCYCFNLAANI